MLEERWRRYLASVAFTALFLLIGAGAVIYAQPAAPAAEPPGQTVPPIQLFTKKALTAEPRPNSIIDYEIIFNNSAWITYTGALVGITDTLPVELSVVGPVTASKGTATAVDLHLITWTGVLTYGDHVTINYQAWVAPTVTTTTLTNEAILWEKQGPSGWLTPTNRVLTATAAIQVQPIWPEAYLPVISVPPLPTATPVPVSIPQPGNWNFEQGRTGAWIEQSNNKPGKLIYKNGEGITVVLPPYGGQPNNYFAWLGGEYSAVNILDQRVPLPAGLSQMSLTFDAWIDSADDCGKDMAQVFVNGKQVGAYELCKSKNSPIKPGAGGWSRQTIDITTAGAFTGQSVPLTFQVTTDGAKNSNWYIDNVRLCSTDPRAAAADRCN